MDNQRLNITPYFFSLLIAALLLSVFIPKLSTAQDTGGSYEILPAPDLWYNSVDGVRAGVRVRGQVPGTFGDGPHRLNAGLWVGTKFPTYPVSYYLRFTEPIPSLSEFSSEANISLETSFRTGFQDHGISFNKRWQPGFNELNYTELSIGFRAEERFKNEYLLYPQLWQDQWLYILSADLNITNEGRLGRYVFSFSTDGNIAGSASSFIRSEISFRQQVDLSEDFKLFGRLYSGFASEQTAPEYLFMNSLKSPRYWMDKGLTRAKGTIPPGWMEIGNIQVTGGPGLRGYNKQNIKTLNLGIAPLFTSLSSINLELDYPNPLDQAMQDIPILGEFISLRSYLFFDAGTSLGLTSFEEDRVLSDAGPGFLFSINIPDYLGRSRGISIRYDMPLWLSDPGAENSFKFRNIIGIGTIISL